MASCPFASEVPFIPPPPSNPDAYNYITQPLYARWQWLYGGSLYTLTEEWFTGNAQVFRSTDGGLNWNYLDNPNGTFRMKSGFLDGTRIVTVGKPSGPDRTALKDFSLTTHTWGAYYAAGGTDVNPGVVIIRPDGSAVNVGKDFTTDQHVYVTVWTGTWSARLHVSSNVAVPSSNVFLHGAWLEPASGNIHIVYSHRVFPQRFFYHRVFKADNTLGAINLILTDPGVDSTQDADVSDGMQMAFFGSRAWVFYRKLYELFALECNPMALPTSFTERKICDVEENFNHYYTRYGGYVSNDGTKLVFLYTEADRIVGHDQDSGCNQLFRRTSTDGTTWSAKSLVWNAYPSVEGMSNLDVREVASGGIDGMAITASYDFGNSQAAFALYKCAAEGGGTFGNYAF